MHENIDVRQFIKSPYMSDSVTLCIAVFPIWVCFVLWLLFCFFVGGEGGAFAGCPVLMSLYVQLVGTPGAVNRHYLYRIVKRHM